MVCNAFPNRSLVAQLWVSTELSGDWLQLFLDINQNDVVLVIKKIVNGLQLDYQVNLCFYIPLYCSLIQLGFGFELTRSGFKSMLCIVWEIWLFVTNIASLKYFLSSRAIIGSITCSLINDNLPWINSLQIVLWIKYVILFHNLNSNASFN